MRPTLRCAPVGPGARAWHRRWDRHDDGLNPSFRLSRFDCSVDRSVLGLNRPHGTPVRPGTVAFVPQIGTIHNMQASARLRRYNLAAACLHAFSALLVIILANNFALPVTADYMTGPPGSPQRQMV